MNRLNERPKLSTLVRQGATRPQGFGQLVEQQDGSILTCAIGGAYEAATGNLPYKISTWQAINFLTNFFGIDYDLKVPYPGTGNIFNMAGEQYFVLRVITYLNDWDQWSKAEIADWLEQQGL